MIIKKYLTKFSSFYVYSKLNKSRKNFNFFKLNLAFLTKIWGKKKIAAEKRFSSLNNLVFLNIVLKYFNLTFLW